MHCPLKSQFSLSRLKTEVWQQGPSFLPTERFLFFFFKYIYIFYLLLLRMSMCHGAHMEDRGQLCGVGSLLLPVHGLQEPSLAVRARVADVLT